jgi:ribonucleoside-diphosphate reductase alpha chain
MMAQDTALSVDSDTAGPSTGAGNGNGGHAATPGTTGASAAPPTDAPAADAQPAAASFTDTPPVVPAKIRGLDLGPACNQCGGMMQRTGSCYTCSSCGNNTGCG